MPAAMNFSIGANIASSFKSVVGAVTRDLSGITADFNKKSQIKMIGDDLINKQAQLPILRKRESEAAAKLLRLDKKRIALDTRLQSIKGKRDKESLRLGRSLRTELSLMKAQVKESKGIVAESKKAISAVDKLSSKYDKLGGNSKDVLGTNQKITRELKHHQKIIDQTSRAEKARESRNKHAGRAAVGAGVTVAMGAGLLPAIGFEDGGTRLRTVTEDRAARDKGLAHALNYSRSGNLSTATEMIEIQYALNSAGLQGDASRFGSEIVSKVAKITNGSSEAVGEIVGTVFNNMGEAIEGNTGQKMAKIGDMLTQAQLQFQLRDFGQLGESFKGGAKAINNYKLDLDQATLALGLFNNAGATGSSAGTALAASLRQMGKASEEMGFEVERNSRGGIDLVRTLHNLKSATQDLGDEEQEKAFQKSFGDEGSAVRLLIKDMKKLDSQYAKLKKNSKGAVDKNYQFFLESTSGKLQILKNKVVGSAIAIGSKMLPVLGAGIDMLSVGATAIGGLIDMFPNLSGGLGLVALGGAAAFTAISSMGAIIGAVTFGIASWNAAMLAAGGRMTLLTTASLRAGAAILWSKGVMLASTVAVWAMNSALLANPITWVAVGAIALGAAMYKLYDRFEAVRIIARGVGKVLFWPFVSTYKAVTSVIDILGSFGSIAMNSLRPVGKAVFNYFLKPYREAFDWVGKKFDWFGGKVKWFKSILSSVAGYFGLRDEDQEEYKKPLEKTDSPGAKPHLSSSKIVNDAAKAVNRATTSNTTMTLKNEFNIQPSEGMDERKLAEKVVEVMDEKERENERKYRSKMGDY